MWTRNFDTLTDTIKEFGEPEVTTKFSDKDGTSQMELKEQYEGFIQILLEIGDACCSDANDISTRIRLIKTAAATTNPLCNYKLRELDLIVEEVSQKLHKYQSDIAQHCDKIIKTIRKFKVPESDDELFKAVAAFLQVEKNSQEM